MRDQDDRAALRGETAHEIEQLACHDDVQTRGRLIEDDELDRLVRHRERARDLHHLALRERQVADDVGGRDRVAGEDGVELADDQLARIAAPAQAAEVRVEDPGVLGDRQVGAQRELLEDAAHARVVCRGHRPAGAHVPGADGDGAFVRQQRAGQHVHERRLAGAVVAHEADALARLDPQVDAIERAHRAEGLLDPLQARDRAGTSRHLRSTTLRGPVRDPGIMPALRCADTTIGRTTRRPSSRSRSTVPSRSARRVIPVRGLLRRPGSWPLR